MNDEIDTALSLFSRSDHIIKWEMLKQRLIKCVQQYSKKLAEKNNKQRTELETEITNLKAELSHIDDDQKLERLKNCNTELENITTLKTAGIIFRCKARWYGEGEKNSKYFFNLEKSRYRA